AFVSVGCPTSRWFRLATAKRRCSRHNGGVGLRKNELGLRLSEPRDCCLIRCRPSPLNRWRPLVVNMDKESSTLLGSTFHAHSTHSSVDYCVLLPADFDPSERLPLILHLHGAMSSAAK